MAWLLGDSRFDQWIVTDILILEVAIRYGKKGELRPQFVDASNFPICEINLQSRQGTFGANA